MKIVRLRVEEGFFDGLDLQFDTGLNVVIGGRGVGKTSVIELIRFALGAPGNDNSHAKSVLRSGEVTVDVEINDNIFSVSRTADDEVPRSAYQFSTPIVYSQTEIESVGLSPEGRLRLIDSFLPRDSEFYANAQRVVTEIRALAVGIQNARASLSESSGEEELSKLLQREKELVSSQFEFAQKNVELERLQKELDGLYAMLDSEDKAARDVGSLIDWLVGRVDTLKSLRDIADISEISALVGNSDVRLSVQELLIRDKKEIDGIISRSEALLSRLKELLQLHSQKKSEVDSMAREKRGIVNQYNENAGAISREIGTVRSRISQLQQAIKAQNEKLMQLQSLYTKCDELCKLLDESRAEIYNNRRKVVEYLNARLNPSIEVEILHLSNQSHYKRALEQVLRGSGLRYAEILDDIVEKVSPHELFKHVREKSFESFSSIVGITADRGARVLGALYDVDLGGVITAPLYDGINFMLIDGVGYKGINDLSIGQRCTVSLSIVLENLIHPLLIDQPEDHLDNEYVALTLVEAIKQRSLHAQTIVCTHNANIPVLGEASKVICLGSNGKRGYVREEGEIDSVAVRALIEGIMEGGKSAFSKRAVFYG